MLLFNFFVFSQDFKGCEEIRDAYSHFSKDVSNSEYAELYISKMPSNFKEFYQTFSHKEGCINDSAFYYVRLLRKSRGLVGDKSYFPKIFRMSLGGFYEVDGISALQNMHHYLLKSKCRVTFVSFLEQQTISDLNLYFDFIFDINKDSLFFEEVKLKELKSKYPKVYNCMKKRFK